MFDKKQLKVLTGCCLAAFAFLALICLVMHFSFAGLMIFIGAALMTIGAFTESLQMLLPCGFARITHRSPSCIFGSIDRPLACTTNISSSSVPPPSTFTQPSHSTGSPSPKYPHAARSE